MQTRANHVLNLARLTLEIWHALYRVGAEEEQ